VLRVRVWEFGLLYGTFYFVDAMCIASEGRNHVGRWKVNVKMELKIGCELLDWISLWGYSPVRTLNAFPDSIKLF
jgi:hypothetical protein